MPARKLDWRPVGQGGDHPGGREFAPVMVLEHSAGPSGYEVKMVDYAPAGKQYVARLWHGNRGHAVGGEHAGCRAYYATAGEARDAC